jgi:hypothetical protein
MSDTTPVQIEQPVPRRRGNASRWVMHGILALVFAGASGGLLVYPQWLAYEGSRRALSIQQERENELTERLEQTRIVNGMLRDWRQSERRVLLRREAKALPKAVAYLAKDAGVSVKVVQVSTRRAPHWQVRRVERPVDGESSFQAEIQPRLVRMVLLGTWDGIYKTMAGLTQQQPLFIPERYSLTTQRSQNGRRLLRAVVLATVFVADDGEEPAPAKAVTGPVASAAALTGWTGQVEAAQ